MLPHRDGEAKRPRSRAGRPRIIRRCNIGHAAPADYSRRYRRLYRLREVANPGCRTVRRRVLMRTLTILRALTLAAALSAPLAQAALAGQQQAMTGQSVATAPTFITGPYDQPVPSV